MHAVATRRRAAALLGLLAVGFCAAACKKQSESLIVVALTASPPDLGLASASIVVADAASPGQTVTRPFMLSGGLSGTPASFGVYIPSELSGPVDVRVTAADLANTCAGYVGSAGPTAQTGSITRVSVTLVPGDICGTGGAGGGGGGEGGTDGAAGAGGADGGGGGPPSLAHCTEYVHNVNLTAPCVMGDPNTDVEITDVAFTADGKILFTAGEDGRVKVWTWDGTMLTAEGHELDTSGGFTSLAISDDNQFVAAGGIGGRLTAWNVDATWPLAAQLTGIVNDINSVAFGPGVVLYAIDDQRNLFVYTSAHMTPQSTMVLRTVPFIIGTSPVLSDGSYWLGIGYDDGNASLISVNGTAMSAEVPFVVSQGISNLYTIRFSPDGKLVAAGTDNGTFRIFTLPAPSSTAAPTPTTPATALTTDFVWNAAFHPSNAYIAIADGSQPGNRRLGIWNVATGALQASLPLASLAYQPRSLTFSPDGRALVVGERNCGKVLVCTDGP